MKNKNTWYYAILLLLIGIVYSNNVNAQAPTYSVSSDAENWECGLNETMMAQLMTDTGFVGRMARYNNFINNPPDGNQPQAGAPFIVPVVFHIIQPTGTPASAVTYAKIQWQVARFNAGLLNQMNLFNGQVNGPRSVNTQIEFRLACVAQNCGAGFTSTSEPGVMRYYTPLPNVLNQNVLAPSTFTPMLAITHPTTCATTFPFANYLNIWCVPSIDGGTVIGYGTFPWLGAAIDGIVMDIDAVGNNSYGTNFPMIGQLDKGAVLTHEIGHYLGLYHTFQPQTFGCTLTPNLSGGYGCYGITPVTAICEGDLILDTPPTSVTADLGSISTINTCIESNFPYGLGLGANVNDQLENYMSYSDDDKLNTFTQGQANRMQSAFTNTAFPLRTNLNSVLNMANTGVLPQTCSATANILTGIFNYSLAPLSNCTTVNIQFTNPLSVGFNTVGTTYTWNFGDATTGSLPNPLHAYSTSGGTTYVVSCTATNGTATATYTQTISFNFNVNIVGQSGLNMPVCRGSEQTIFLNFGVGVPSVLLTDGTSTVTVYNSMNLTMSHNQPYTFVANASASYSLVPVNCYTGTATFNVVDCCNNLVTNGDFESGLTSFNVSPYFTAASPLGSPLVVLGTTYAPSITPNTGFAYFGGFSGLGTPTIPQGCNTTTLEPFVWQATVSGLRQSTTYYYAFKISEAFNNSGITAMNACTNFNFRTKIYDASGSVFQSGILTPIRNIGPGTNPNAHIGYQVYAFTFTTSASVSPIQTFSIEINQLNNFNVSNYDFILDNILLQATTPGIQALGSNTICPGQTAALTTTVNCSQLLSNYNVAWTPTVGLSCITCTNPIASPSITTIYTLVATPTSTVGSPPAIFSTVTVTVKPTFTINPTLTYVYAGGSATITAGASTGSYTWNPGSVVSNTIVVTPTATTIYTVTNAATGTCTPNNTATVVVSTACSQSATATHNDVTFTSGTYTTTNQVLNLSGTITFTNNTSFAGYTMRMAPGTLLKVNDGATLTFDNCKIFGCTELWQGIKLETLDSRQASIDVKNGTTIEDMYLGIYRNVTYTTTNNAQSGYIKITDSKLNKNYIGVQILNMPSFPTSGSSYSLTVKNSTLTTASSTTSPGNTLKPSTIPSYTYAYNKIAGGASGTTTSYTAFPRSHIGINLNNLSTTNNVVIGDSAGAANTFNTFSNLDFGIVAKNAQLRVHNNSFVNLKGSLKHFYIGTIFNPVPMPVGPDEIGIAVVAQHTIANTYSLQVGTKSILASMNLGVIYPKSNTFKTLNKGISAKNCDVVIVKGNWFEADTTDIPGSDGSTPGSPNTYEYYKAQSAVWITGLSKGSTLYFNYIRNYRSGLSVSQTMSVTAGAYITIKSNNIQSLSTIGYCKEAINLEQVGGANIAADLLSVSTNVINRVYNGILAKNIAGGLNINNNSNITLDNVKIYGKQIPMFYSHSGISLSSVTNAKVRSNANINSITTVPFTASTSTLTNGVYLSASANNTIICNTVNNVGRGFYFQGNCTSPNGWLGNGISNSYRGLELKTSGVIGTQGAPSSTLAANTWSNVTQETYVSGTMNANTASKMFVSPNSGSPKTSPTFNFSVAPSPNYQTGLGFGIDEQIGTPFSCGGGGTNMAMAASGSSSGSSTSISNDGLYSNLATSANTVYPTYADEMVYQSQELVYALQKQGLVTKNASNPTLQSFYNANITSNIGKFTDVQDALANSNKTLAQSKNNSINPTNTVQQKTKRTNELMLKLNINCNYQYTNAELQDLVSMANECEVKGWYVAQSRSILNTISGTLINYADNCEDTKATARMANEEEKSTSIIEPKRSFNLFPNPNNGSMTMTYDLGKDTEGNMNLYDVTGKLINTYNLLNTNGSIEINENQLHNGIYFYCILVNGIKVNTNKIVIIK